MSETVKLNPSACKVLRTGMNPLLMSYNVEF